MKDWLDTLLQAPRDALVLITVASTRGSAPREVGARMLVWEDGIVGTIGGGNLEYQAIDIARQRLQDESTPRVKLQRFALGPSLGQCCGGVVELLFESVTGREICFAQLQQHRRERRPAVLLSVVEGDCGNARLLVTETECHGEVADSALRVSLVARARAALAGCEPAHLCSVAGAGDAPLQALLQPFRAGDLQVLVFGAGHVGAALVPMLAQFPCEISWIDSRAEEFPDLTAHNVRRIESATPEFCVDDALPGSYYLIMTHSHALDQAICERILRRGDFAYCGLIGSRAKRLKFERRLRTRGVRASALQRLVCPIGIAGIEGKRPAEIAVAVAAQLLIEYGRSQRNQTTPPQTLVARGD